MPEYSAKQPPKMEPTHPGAILREDVLPALNLTVTEAARQLGVSRQMLHSILAERRPFRRRWRYALGGSVGMGPASGFACRPLMICGMPSGSCATKSGIPEHAAA